MIYPEVFSFAQSSLYYAFKNSDGMGQGIVILLFVFSVFTWTLMLEKGISLRRAHNDCASFLRRFRERRNPLSMNDELPMNRALRQGFAKPPMNGSRP